MTIALNRNRTTSSGSDCTGMLRKADLDRCQARLVDEMRPLGSVRLLFVLDRFEGWEPQRQLERSDLLREARRLIERIAIVGDERWRSETLMFAGADLREGSSRVLCRPPAAIADARTWLTS